MKFSISKLILVLSIAAIASAVKARAAGKPGFNRSTKSGLRDSVKDTDQKDLADLIAVMMQKGLDGKMGANLAPVIGLSGPMPMKAVSIRNVYKGKVRDALNCAVIYEDSSESGKKATCVYLMKISENSKTQDSQFFKINLNGKLEKVVNSRVAKDSEGKLVHGSGIASDLDLNSPTVQKSYTAEMKAVKAWLKEQQVAMAKKAPTEEVKAAAEKETEKLDKEASETH